MKLYLALLLFFLLSACGSSPPSPVTPVPEPPPEKKPFSCPSSDDFSSSVYSISVDGIEVGREIRTSSFRSGPFGKESLKTSHIVKRTGFGAFDFDTLTVRSELTSVKDGSLLRASFSVIDPIKGALVSDVGFNGSGWERLKEHRDSPSDPPYGDPSSLPLSGDEIIGLSFFDLLSKHFSSDEDSPFTVSYYNASLDAPVLLDVSKPISGKLIGDNPLDGTWITVFRAGTDRVFMKVFFDSSGVPVFESYPAIHQERVLVDDFVPFPTAKAKARSGRLFSKTYVGLIHRVSHAKFSLKSVKPVSKDSFSFLNTPSNQKLEELGPKELLLSVSPGTPDDGTYPTEDDTSQDDLVLPDSPVVRGACRYLRSGGKSGSLLEERKLNSAAVVSKSSLIRNPAAFWKNNDKVAKLVMEYVYSLIPNKIHLPGMVDAEAILRRGSGDCREHSVLFSSIMRSFGVPTRLVSGAFLNHGGAWEPHLWAIYWTGSKWRQIDPANNTVDPGGLYVAFGNGSHTFSELKSDVASFLDNSFSGVSFDLIEASAEGEKMHLARPRKPSFTGSDSHLFNAAIQSSRGDHLGALSSISTLVDRSHSIKPRVFKAELLVSLERYEEALLEIASLRDLTSSPSNTHMLDLLEFKALLKTGVFDKAENLLETLGSEPFESDPVYVIHKSDLLAEKGDLFEAIDLLDGFLERNPRNPHVLAAIGRLLSRFQDPSDDFVHKNAFSALDEAVFFSRHCDADSLFSLAQIHFDDGRYADSLAFARMALAFRPLDPTIISLVSELKEKLSSCP